LTRTQPSIGLRERDRDLANGKTGTASNVTTLTAAARIFCAGAGIAR
jgi:hypothetical protein